MHRIKSRGVGLELGGVGAGVVGMDSGGASEEGPAGKQGIQSWVTAEGLRHAASEGTHTQEQGQGRKLT